MLVEHRTSYSAFRGMQKSETTAHTRVGVERFVFLSSISEDDNHRCMCVCVSDTIYIFVPHRTACTHGVYINTRNDTTYKNHNQPYTHTTTIQKDYRSTVVHQI